MHPFISLNMKNYSYKHIWLITYPILISLAMEHMIGLTDTAFLGRVGEVELGASALAGVYYLAIFMLGFGFSIGAQIMIARRNGEADYKAIGPLFQQGSIFLFSLAILIITFSLVYSPVILRKLISSEQVYNATISYMNWRVFGFMFSFVAVMFRAFYVGTTNTKILTINSVVMVLSNVGLNYVLIFGKLGFPEMGIAGAAIASSVAEFVSLAFFIIYTYTKIPHRKYGLFSRNPIQFKFIRHMLGISVWTMLQSFIAVATWFLFFVAIEHLGERPLAITNVVRSISAMMFMVISAFGSTASALVGNLMGSGQQHLVMGTIWRIIKLCYMVVLPIMAIMMLFPTMVIRIYTDNPDLIANTVSALLVMVSAYLVMIPSFIMFNSVSGTGNTRSALFIEFMALIVYVIYIYYIVIYLRVDVALCWTSEHVYSLAMISGAYLYLKKANWQSKKI